MKPFDPVNIKIEGKNLIEASAGTGKTYSIGILVLRLILEKDIKIEDVLMVTFTNAAVAELDIRIRKFLREAYNISQKHTNKNENYDPLIEKIVIHAIETKGIEHVTKLLSNALLFLDEISINTIHSFCQMTLTEFPFETEQLFNTEIIEDADTLIEDAVNKYWRNHITILDKELLKLLVGEGYSRKMIIDFVKNIFNGKTLKINNLLTDEQIAEIVKLYKNHTDVIFEKFLDYIKINWDNISAYKTGTYDLGKMIEENNPEAFAKKFIEKYFKSNPPAYLLKFDGVYAQMQEYEKEIEEYNKAQKDILINYLHQAEKFIVKEVETKKNRNQVLSFYDLISTLYNELVVKNNVTLQEKLRKKYKAVFIDEFQDTDNWQYGIFQKAFVEKGNTIVFFIGDPKQSIYSWRGADLNTYIKAKKDISTQYTMQNNFRSTEAFINAMNEFFPAGTCSENKISNPFCSEEIRYETVFPANKETGILYDNDNIATSFDMVTSPLLTNKQSHYENAGREVLYLLQNGKISKKGVKTAVKPENIAVLVRSNHGAKEMKKILTKLNIPAVVTDETKIMETDEATDLYYVVYAMINPVQSTISRALLTSFTGFTTEDILKLDNDITKSDFINFQNRWGQSGIYSAILEFISRYKVKSYLLNEENRNGNRIYTNLMQLAEILNEKETYDNFGPEKLLDWFQKSREGLKNENKYEQRIESDDNSVTISTIHKSKGLSYDIVILPDSNFKIKKPEKYISYATDEKFYISYYLNEEENRIYELQMEQENRRLLYVAITRAVYKCIIQYSTDNKNKKGTLMHFHQNLGDNNKNITFRIPVELKKNWYSPEKSKNLTTKKPILFTGKIDNKWKVTSFSSLDSHYMPGLINQPVIEINRNEYDRFIFDELPKGTKTGLIIHSIFEKIDFQDKAYWGKIIKNTLNIYGRTQNEEETEKYLELVNTVLNSKMPGKEFSLSQIEYDKRLIEMEFFYLFKNWNTKKIKEIFPELIIHNLDIEGIMHGFIDLVFEYKRKYYILDWKTNFLGNDIEDYNKENISKAMNENNYHLQYLIYTIALKRFLEKRIPDFNYEKHFGGVFYLFIRGIRIGESSGIFYKLPDKYKLNSLEQILY